MDLTTTYLIALPAILYLRAVRVLARRGYDVPASQRACWFGGLTAIGIGLLSPLDSLGETDLVSAHMGQHLMIMDIAAPLLLLGLRSPVYAFMLPRLLLAPLALNRPLRTIFRAVQKPLVAAPLWLAVMWGWHLGPTYDAALRSPLLHALQHQSFLVAGMIFWLPVLEPRHRRVPGGLWKIGYAAGARLFGMFVGFALLVARHPYYGDFYGDRALAHGFTPLQDQQLAGGIMMGMDVIVMMVALLFFFFRTAQDAERDELAERASLPAELPETLAAAAARETSLGEPRLHTRV